MLAPNKPGTHELVIYVACESWIGSEVRVPVKIEIKPKSALPQSEEELAAMVAEVQAQQGIEGGEEEADEEMPSEQARSSEHRGGGGGFHDGLLTHSDPPMQGSDADSDSGDDEREAPEDYETDDD